MAQVSLALVVLKTPQLDRVRGFYERLGIAFHKEQHSNGPAHYSAEVGTLVLEIYPLRDSDASCDRLTRLGFHVDNPEAVMQSLTAVHAPIVTPTTSTPWGFRTVVHDPDQRPVELYWN